MKKSIIVIVVIIILGLVVWGFTKNSGTNSQVNTQTPVTTSPSGSIISSTPSAPVTDSTKVSDKLTKYENQELGFSVNYPSTWQVSSLDNGTDFLIPTGSSDTNTLGKLEATITVNSGKCAFPPVTTIKDRSTVASGNLSFNSISMSNSVQGRTYFDRMYSLQNGNVCYMFAFSSISLSPASKGYTGSQVTQMTNNNKALVDSSDQAFMSVVKSFAYVIPPQGKDETQVVPTKK